MSTVVSTAPLAWEERLKRLEEKIARKNLWIVLSMLLNLVIVGAGLYLFGFRFWSRTIEAQNIVLKDPARRPVAFIGVGNNWGGVRRQTYTPGIEFFDENGRQTMLVADSAISLRYEDHRSTLGAIQGLQISSINADARVNNYLVSFHRANSDMLLLSTNDGLKMSVKTGQNSGGIRTQADKATVFALTPKGEIDLVAEPGGTHMDRNVHPQIDAPTTGMH